MCRVLREGIDVHRCLAAQALGHIAHPGAVDALVEALLDADEDVRSDAAGALCRFSDASAAPQLLKNLLGDPCSDVKLNAIEALTRMRHPDLVPWLRRLVKERDDDIVWDEEDFYAEGWDGWVDIQSKAVEVLAELAAEDAAGDIVEALDDEFGQDLTEVGFKALANLGEAGVAALARYLAHSDERRRRRAAAALAGADSEAAGDAVVRALRDRSVAVRLAAARALAARAPADERLVALFRDAMPEVRAEAVRLCGDHHPDRIETLLDDEAPAVRRAVIEVLAAAPTLLPAAAVVERAGAWLRDADAGLAAAAAAALAAVDPAAALDDLVAQLADGERPLEVRLGAVKGLSGIGGERAVRALADGVADDRRQLRLEAMAALAGLAAGDAQWPNAAGETLLAALRGELVAEPVGEQEPEAESAASTGDDGDATVDGRQAAAGAAFPTSTLESILDGDPGAPLAVSEDGAGVELTEEDMAFRDLSKRIPRKKSVPVTPRIAPYEDVRRFAARVLGGVARDVVAEALVGCLADGDEDVRRAAADSLARVADRLATLPGAVVDALLRHVTVADRDMRLAIVRALGAAGGEQAVAALIGRLGDDDSFVRSAALRALSRIGAAGPEIEARLDDPDPGVRSAAAVAVAATGGAGAVEALVAFAFAFEGHHRREAGRLLREVHPAAASARLLEVLNDRRRLRSWQVAIEALDELNRTDLAVSDGAMT